MRRILLGLLKKYFDLTMVIKDTLIIGGSGTKQMIRIISNLSANAWEVKDTVNKLPDYDKTKKMMEEERERLADDIYQFTNTFLRIKNKLEEWRRKDGREAINTHQDKVFWSVGALINYGVFDLYDIMYLESLEKDEMTYGFKREAERVESEEEEVLKEFYATIKGE